MNDPSAPVSETTRQIVTVVTHVGSTLLMSVGVLGIGLFLFAFVIVGPRGLPVWRGLVPLALFLVGAYYDPTVRRRLHRRGALTQFGRVQPVDERVLTPLENRSERCDACSGAMDRGLVRRHLDEFVVAGVPVRQLSKRFDYYCLDCCRDGTVSVGQGENDSRSVSREATGRAVEQSD